MNRSRATLLALVFLALALRLPWLGAIPNPAGDEGNWAWYGLELLEHRPVALHPDARFVSMAFARMIALAYALLGPSFAAARSVLVVGVTSAVVASWALARRLSLARAALAIAATLALHPWSIIWSRTVCVPYALALSLGVVGPLAWLDALRTRRWWAVLLASHLVCAAMHFSPLALVPIGACSLWALYKRLPLKLVPVALTGLAHAIPFVTSALAAMRVGSQTVPPLREPLIERLSTMCAMLLGDLAGTSSAAHLAGCSRWELRLGASLAFAFAVGVFAHARRGGERARFAALHLALAFAVTPLLLVPARA